MIRDKISFLLLENWKVKIISIVLAVCVFSFFYYFNHSSRTVTIALEVNLPSDYEAESLIPNSVEINIVGNQDLIYLIDPNLINATIDFSSVKKEGISITNVILDYDEKMFSKGNINLVANPQRVKVSFKLKD